MKRCITILLFLALSAATSRAAILVLQIEDLGPANAINGNSQTGVLAGQKAGAATTFDGASVTMIAAPTSEATSIAGDWVTGYSNSIAANSVAIRYNTQTLNLESFPITSQTTLGVDVLSDGTALLDSPTPSSDISVLWKIDNSFDLVLGQFGRVFSRGLNESGQGVVYETSNNAALFFDLSDISQVTSSLIDYDATAGFEGLYTAGIFDTSDPEPAFFKIGDVNPTVIPKLDVSNMNGEVTAFNTSGIMVGNWDSEYFLYDSDSTQLTNLSDLAMTGDNFQSLEVPTSIDETGTFYGVGLFESSPGVFEPHAYAGQVAIIPEPSSLMLLALGLMSVLRGRRSN